MTKGKPWSIDEEIKLKQLWTSGENLETIATKLGKSPEAILQKTQRLGLKEEVGAKQHLTTTSIQLPADLPSSEEALKMLAGALDAATQPGLDKVEVQRLQVVATLARTYDHLLANYIRYREIETKLMELEQKYAQLAQKSKNDAT